MIETRSYPAFSAFPVTGPRTGPTRLVVEARTTRVSVNGTSFQVLAQFSNEQPTLPDGVPGESSWSTFATLTPGRPFVDVPSPARYVRAVLVSGTLVNGRIEEETRTTPVADAMTVLPQLREQVDAIVPDLVSDNLADVNARVTQAQAAASTAGATASTALSRADEALARPVGGSDPALHVLTKYPSVTDLLTATPNGDTAYLNRAVTDLTAPLTLNARKDVQALGVEGYITTPNGAGGGPLATVDIPDAGDGSRYSELWHLENVMLSNTSAGTDALRIDLTAKADGSKPRLARPLFTRLFTRASSVNGWAFHVINPNTWAAKDSFFCSTFLHCAFSGGVRITGGGDSNVFLGTTITGPKGLYVELNTRYDTNTGSIATEASQTLVLGCNVTADDGIQIQKGTRTRVAFNNMELVTTGNTALTTGQTAFIGTGNVTVPDPNNPSEKWTEVIEGGTIMGNYIGNAVARPAVSLHYANGTQVFNNTFEAGTGLTFNLVIENTAKNTVVGPNVFKTMAGYEIKDEGVGTYGVLQSYGRDVTGRIKRYMHPSRSNKANYEFQTIKAPDAIGGRVFLYGAITGGTTAVGDVLIVLPDGQRPPANRYPMIDCTAITTDADGTGATRQMTFVIVNPTGEVVLGENLAKPVLQEIRFAGQSFIAPNV